MSTESRRCECCGRRLGVQSVRGLWCCARCAEADTELEQARPLVPDPLHRLFRRGPGRAD